MDLFQKINFDFLNQNLKPKTLSEGRSDFVEKNNSLMIEESNFGRLLEVDLKNKKILWQYKNSNKSTGDIYRMNWSRRLIRLPGDLNKDTFAQFLKPITKRD